MFWFLMSLGGKGPPDVEQLLPPPPFIFESLCPVLSNHERCWLRPLDVNGLAPDCAANGSLLFCKAIASHLSLVQSSRPEHFHWTPLACSLCEAKEA